MRCVVMVLMQYALCTIQHARYTMHHPLPIKHWHNTHHFSNAQRTSS
jgi:hypothetical protein